MENRFLIVTEGMNPFESDRSRHRSGRVERSSREPRKFEVIAFSALAVPTARGRVRLGDLPPPLATVRMPLAQGGDPGKFIQISTAGANPRRRTRPRRWS